VQRCLPAAVGLKKQSETLAMRGRPAAGDGPEKTKPTPWCNAACLWRSGPKKQSETLAMRSRLPRVTGLKKRTQRAATPVISYWLLVCGRRHKFLLAQL
jgi:hypothetical protein